MTSTSSPALERHAPVPVEGPEKNSTHSSPFPVIITQVRGQVVHARKLSKKLFFFDVRVVTDVCSGSGSHHTFRGDKLRVIVKYDEVRLDKIASLWRKVRVGDSVRIEGFQETSLRQLQVQNRPNQSSQSQTGPGPSETETGYCGYQDHNNENETAQPSSLPLLFHCLDIESIERYSGQVPFIPEAPLKTQQCKIPPIFRIVGSGEDGEFGHNSSSSSSGQKLCKFWLSTGKCQLGDDGACPFLHLTSADPQSLNLERKMWIKQRNLDRRQKQVDLDPHSPAQKHSSFHRARIFAEWLIATFGREFLSSSASGSGGVLDIAGGRGDVSFYLQTVGGVKATLIDPRERKFSRRQLKMMRKLASNSRDSSSSSSLIGSQSDHFQCEFDDEFVKTHGDLVRNATVLIGLHPDQVTEYIAQVAISADKPFAIVPCCVFGHLFPDRRIVAAQNDGRSDRVPKPVVTYEEFVIYLTGLSVAVQKDYLNFEGRNLVLWNKK